MIPNGWTQNWTVSQQGNDSIVSYKFTKNRIKNLRLYVTKLECNNDLYNYDESIINKKDSVINTYSSRINNDSIIINSKDSINVQTNIKLSNVKLEYKNYKKKTVKRSIILVGASLLLGLLL
jgi:hypothetical protein